MSWKSENLWALATKERLEEAKKMRLSVFQQRWIAKREVRGYHVPNIPEKQLISRHFDGRIKLQALSKRERERVPPVATLAFARLERRLDVVVFRSHFSKSIFDARKSVINGWVKVNGVQVIVFLNAQIQVYCAVTRTIRWRYDYC